MNKYSIHSVDRIFETGMKRKALRDRRPGGLLFSEGSG